MSKRPKSIAPRLAGIALAGALTAASLVACSAQDEQVQDEQVTEDVYCTTEDGTIVDENLCDQTTHSSGGGGGVYFLSHGNYGSGLQPGYKITGGNRIPYNDAAQRKSLGLPETGKVTGKTGGFGSTITRSVPGSGAKSSAGKAGGFGGGGTTGGS